MWSTIGSGRSGRRRRATAWARAGRPSLGFRSSVSENFPYRTRRRSARGESGRCSLRPQGFKLKVLHILYLNVSVTINIICISYKYIISIPCFMSKRIWVWYLKAFEVLKNIKLIIRGFIIKVFEVFNTIKLFEVFSNKVFEVCYFKVFEVFNNIKIFEVFGFKVCKKWFQ